MCADFSIPSSAYGRGGYTEIGENLFTFAGFSMICLFKMQVAR